MLTQQELKTLLRYNQRTGVFTHIKKRSYVRVGDVAGCIGPDGYRYIGAGGRQYKASRLAVLYMTGEWPRGQVDHKNRNRADDRWVNLRDVSHAENQQNCTPLRKNNTSGVRGVSWCSKRRRWQAHIQAHGRQHNLGVFKTIEEAAAAYRAAEKALHITKGEKRCQAQ